jgi:hypothetical protein
MKHDHDKIKAELLALKRRGVIQPQAVVKAARNPKSPLHQLFTWDNSKAAEQWRLEEARRLLRTYVIVENNDAAEPLRCFVSLSTDRKSGGGYRHIADVLNEKELYQRLLADSIEDLRAFQARYEKLKELRPVFDAAQRVEKLHGRKWLLTGFKDLPGDEGRSATPSSSTHAGPIRSRPGEGAGNESAGISDESRGTDRSVQPTAESTETLPRIDREDLG